MKRFIVFAVALALVAFGALAQPVPTFAQSDNCTIDAGTGFSLGTQLRGHNGAEVITTTVTSQGLTHRIVLQLLKPYSGPVQVEVGPPFTPLYGVFVVNCTGNNAELATTPCGRVGVDIAVERFASPFNGPFMVEVQAFKNGVLFDTQTKNVNPGTAAFVPLEFSFAAPDQGNYTYKSFCRAPTLPNLCGFYGNNAPMGEGVLARKCDAPPGPSHAGARLGRMIVSVPFHWAPQAGAASTFIAEAGKTFKTLGSSGGFTQVILATGTYWVPSEAIEIIE
jgi:hypothetical protein